MVLIRVGLLFVFAVVACSFLVAPGAATDPFGVKADPGNFTVTHVSMATKDGNHWKPGAKATVTIST